MPEPGQIVERIETAGGVVVLRYPLPGDAAALLQFINTISSEQTFILFQGEQLTLAQEEGWLAGRLAGIQAGNEVFLLAETGGEVIGTTGISRKPLAERHVAAFGISVAASHRGQGIGTRMLRAITAEAETHLAGLRIIELSVFANNVAAIRLYEREGFVAHGNLPGGILHLGVYVDHLLMHWVVAGAGRLKAEGGPGLGET